LLSRQSGINEMTRWQISLPIDGLHDVIKEPTSELTIDNIKFHYRESERVGMIVVESDKRSDAENEAAYQINRSLSKICFVYNTEASIGQGCYEVDLTNDPNNEYIYTEFRDRWSYVKEDPSTTLSKIETLDPQKLEILNLALTYYKISEYANPLRIESLFSCMTVLARDLGYKRPDGHVYTSDLKNSIKDVLRQRTSNFDETQFEKDWDSFYSDERCSISHGKGSKLVNVRTLGEHEKIVNTVGGWAREMIYYYIDKGNT
jgi:hypothetical protein